jgi:anhydro-N-acetylmuramic acid kinase
LSNLESTLANRKIVKALGVMSGTSMDAIDVALIETDGNVHINACAFGVGTYDPALREILLQRLVDPTLASAPPPRDLVDAVTDAHCRAVEEMIETNHLSLSEIDLIGFHGQTIFHAPDRRLTIQIFDGQRASRRLKTPVVSDFRTADILAGGQGAPLAPLFHRAKFGDIREPIAVVNIGGVSNITYFDHDTILAFDTGPGSALIDDFISRRRGINYDQDGLIARSGKINSEIAEHILSISYFDQKPPKSLDRNHFHNVMEAIETLSDADGAATLLELTVRSIAKSRAHLPQTPKQWFICGGGRHNLFLLERLRDLLGVPVNPVEILGWNGDMVEAECFAWLAVRVVKDLPLSLPTTTGVPFPMKGGRIDYP